MQNFKEGKPAEITHHNHCRNIMHYNKSRCNTGSNVPSNMPHNWESPFLASPFSWKYIKYCLTPDWYDLVLGLAFNWDFPIYFLDFILRPQIKSVCDHIMNLLFERKTGIWDKRMEEWKNRNKVRIYIYLFYCLYNALISWDGIVSICEKTQFCLVSKCSHLLHETMSQIYTIEK